MKSPDFKILESQFQDCRASSQKEFTAIWQSIKKIGRDISAIKENHLNHLEKDVSGLKTDMAWVKKIQWYMFTTIVGNLVGILYLIMQVK